jgi:hypothetical protein
MGSQFVSKQSGPESYTQNNQSNRNIHIPLLLKELLTFTCVKFISDCENAPDASEGVVLRVLLSLWLNPPLP